MKSAAIREAFLKYFEEHGHTRVPSSSLIPANDPTLLFTNAGMVQFKDVFLGSERRPYTRAASSQRCVRAGGKHNDLENVGYTARHHTFFEMLGNFSFGDYFKREAIGFAWEFLTGVLQLPQDKLWVTVHVSDDEAADIWLKEIGVDPARFSRLDEDNFWQMGDTGPCGPSSEIFYDHGPEVAGGPPGSPDDDGDRYIEIWNLVFMQYERSADATLTPLPNPSIDTGMGLERIAAVMQGVHSNYEIDLFRNLIAAVAELAGTNDYSAQSLRVIADHIRSSAFLVLDGVLPGNEGRNYVLRRIMRRAIRHGHKLGINDPFFYRLVAPLAREMGDAYPELREHQADVERVIRAEEEQFAATLENGMAILNEAIAALAGDTIAGDVVFMLYDTYGFPIDLTADVARERGLQVDLPGFEAAMQAQRRRSQAAGSFRFDYTGVIKLEGETEFSGYDRSDDDSVVVALFADGQPRDVLREGEQGVVVLQRSPFYAESGGQVGDTGYITGDNGRFEVADTTRTGGNHLHHGKLLDGELRIGETVHATIDAGVRQATALNHSATHLLHAALRQVLGTHVTQKGSLVDSERLRFDFSHFEAMTAAQIEMVEDLVNAQIRANSVVTTELTDMESARRKGAMALFGEKYGDTVRVLTMGDGFSVELCGGTHVQRTGDIGLLRIVSEGGISAGVRRVEAVTGVVALAWSRDAERRLNEVAALVKANRETVVDKVGQLLATSRQLEKELQSLRGRLASSAGSDLAAGARDVDGIKVVAAQVETTDAASLRSTVDQLKSKLGAAVVLLAGVADGEVRLVAGVTRTESGRVKAGDLLRMFAGEIGGKGGGKPDMAQGGGGDATAVAAALERVVPWVEQQLTAGR